MMYFCYNFRYFLGFVDIMDGILFSVMYPRGLQWSRESGIDFCKLILHPSNNPFISS